MLSNAVRVHGRRIYKRGIGHVLKLLAYIEQIDPKGKGPDPAVIWALREFTDIRFPGLFVRFKRMESMVIVSDIISVNIPKSTGSKTGSKGGDIEEMAVLMVDTLASEYGWTYDWILDNVTMDTFIKLSQAIQKRTKSEKTNDQMIALLTAHDPNTALKRIKENAGMQQMTMAEAVQKAKKAVKKNGGID